MLQRYATRLLYQDLSVFLFHSLLFPFSSTIAAPCHFIGGYPDSRVLQKISSLEFICHLERISDLREDWALDTAPALVGFMACTAIHLPGVFTTDS
jgi:hypothetical protein